MRKQTLYDFLEREKRKALKNVEVEFVARRAEIKVEALNAQVDGLGSNPTKLIDLLTTIHTSVRLLNRHLSDADGVYADYNLNRISFDSPKPEDLITVNGVDPVDRKLIALGAENSRLRATFRQLEGIVKSNPAKRAAALLEELGMVVPTEVEEMLPAIKVDMSAYARWSGANEVK